MDDPGQLSEYGKILIIILVGIFLVAMTIMAGRMLSVNKPTPQKLSTYECGEDAVGSSWVQFNPRFYVIALIFLLFDVELIFIFPWATVFGQAEYIAADGRWGWFTLIEMALFVGILIIGLIFVWVKGDLEWVKPIHQRPKVNVSIPSTAYDGLNQANYPLRAYTVQLDDKATAEKANEEMPVAPKIAFKPRFKKPGATS
ncbi:MULTISPECIES: NADH-quinone oxidoreductase subunit A [unclassified Sphingobacterium]|jgi:NADH-quinone oxidoreductase subunit A|uniref:NADH-quinone oxidoreductase subunit A n=1 Tax=unclassified Sphingobacterium TaxID=2609468 RepID=UPI00143BF357|nr:NADH-quinone oxidoreductase subunit A [Sphingobacterium sp. B16(2022)]NJI76011.1 NADH-quinone oxidoreductase subunit A [Sphingobacterium sp. B16(2022)]